MHKGWHLQTWYYYSRMRSKGSRFTLGAWGLRVCSLDVAQPFATVRNRSQPSARAPYGRAYGKFCKRGNFWRFETSRCFVSRSRRGTSWHSDVFCSVWKIVLCGRRNTFATFSEDALQFSWQAQHFGRVHRHFAWQAHHFRRVVLRVFCESHCQGCVKWRQGANSVASVAFCEMWWKLTEASHKTSTLRTSILKLQSMKIGGSLARNARFDAPACLVSSLWFSCGLAVSMREAAKPILFRRFPSRLSCRFAWQAWHCDIPTCLITCRKSFCVAGAIFLRRFHKMSCSFRGRRSTLETSIAILRGRRSTSDVSHCVLYTSHSTLYTPHSALYTSHSTLYISHSTLYTSTLYLRLWKYQGSLRPYVKNDSIYDFNCFNMRNFKYIYIFFLKKIIFHLWFIYDWIHDEI